MIKENVPAAEADALVEAGGRVLYRRTVDGKQVCDVEMPGNGGTSQPPAPPPPPPAVEDNSGESGSDDA